MNLILADIRDSSENLRRMVVESLDRLLSAEDSCDLGRTNLDVLVEGVLYAYQKQREEDTGGVFSSGVATVVNVMGVHCQPYLAQICGTIK